MAGGALFRSPRAWYLAMYLRPVGELVRVVVKRWSTDSRGPVAGFADALAAQRADDAQSNWTSRPTLMAR
jgi:hypothetical protein